MTQEKEIKNEMGLKVKIRKGDPSPVILAELDFSFWICDVIDALDDKGRQLIIDYTTEKLGK